MRAVLISTERGIMGATPGDEVARRKLQARMRKLKATPGAYLRIEWSSPRNVQHHRKLFALLNLVAENSDVYDTPEKAIYALKLCTGYCDPIADPRTGEIVPIARSIAFENMPQDEFEAWYCQALDAVSTHIVPHLRHADRDRVLAEIAEGWL